MPVVSASSIPAPPNRSRCDPFRPPMALLDDRSAAFIVRVWCERGDGPADRVRDWRGSIEHVESGERIFFRELHVMTEFMSRRLQALGVVATDRFWEQLFPEDPEAEPPAKT
jgi:hypothetical protein